MLCVSMWPGVGVVVVGYDTVNGTCCVVVNVVLGRVADGDGGVDVGVGACAGGDVVTVVATDVDRDVAV